MTKPYIMPLGFTDRKTHGGATFLLTNPEDSKELKPGTPVSVWRYLPEHLALGKLRGQITAVGYITATFATVETATDPRWPEDESVLRPRTPVFLAKEDTFEPNMTRMLTQEQAGKMATYARIYSDITKPGRRESIKPNPPADSPDSNHNGSTTLDNTSYSD